MSFSIGLLSTLVFSTTYFWVSSIIVSICALFFTNNLTNFVGLTLGLLLGACHFLNFVDVAPVMHRYYTGLIDTIVVDLEREAIKLVDAIHNGAGQDYTT